MTTPESILALSNRATVSYDTKKCSALDGYYDVQKPIHELRLSVTKQRPDSPGHRLLLACFYCDPDATMETRVGWNRAVFAARRYETVVVCKVAPSPARLDRLLSELPEDQRPQIIVVALSGWLERLLYVPGFFFLAYWFWQRKAYRTAKSLHHAKPFDLVHNVNVCSFREPGYFWKLGIPFVWGPWGGTQNFPVRFLAYVDRRGALSELARNLINCFQFRWGKLRSVISKAHLLVAHKEAQLAVQKVYGFQPERQIEIGIPAILAPSSKTRSSDRPIHILWAGRLETWKALPFLLDALSLLHDEVPFELRVLGEGRCERHWKRRCQRLGIADRTKWIGWPPYSETLPNYEWADVFAFTSLRDTSGTGLFESLSSATPIIGLDHQGASDVMTDECAMRIHVSDPHQVVTDFSAAIRRLACDQELYSRLSRGARKRAESYLWKELARKMDLVYARCLGREQDDEISNASAALHFVDKVVDVGFRK